MGGTSGPVWLAGSSRFSGALVAVFWWAQKLPARSHVLYHSARNFLVRWQQSCRRRSAGLKSARAKERVLQPECATTIASNTAIEANNYRPISPVEWPHSRELRSDDGGRAAGRQPGSAWPIDWAASLSLSCLPHWLNQNTPTLGLSAPAKGSANSCNFLAGPNLPC